MEKILINKGNSKKQYIKSKIDLKKNEDFRKAIDDNFNNPEKYLQFDENVIIGNFYY